MLVLNDTSDFFILISLPNFLTFYRKNNLLIHHRITYIRASKDIIQYLKNITLIGIYRHSSVQINMPCIKKERKLRLIFNFI